MADITGANARDQTVTGAGPTTTTTAPSARRSKVPLTSYDRRFANPAPLALLSFATTLFIWSLYNVHTRHVRIDNVIIGSALAYGGLCQLLAGMWEFANGNTLGATVFTSLAGFWLSYALIIWPSSGAIAAYGSDDHMFGNALGIFLTGWFIVIFLFMVASTRSTFGLVIMFLFLDLMFLLLFIGEFRSSTSTIKAGGWFGVLTAFIAYYLGLAGLLHPNTSHFALPVGDIGRRDINDI